MRSDLRLSLYQSTCTASLEAAPGRLIADRERARLTERLKTARDPP